MLPHIRCIHPGGIEQSLKIVRCGEYEQVYLPSEHFEIPFSATTPIGDWQAPEGFPMCCEFHRSVFTSAIDRMNEFPDCCEGHRGLVKQRWFNKQDYQGLPMKLLHTLSHTEYHILNKIDKEDWYKEITDYVDYCIASFGQFPTGFGSPLGLTNYLANVRHVLESRDFVPKGKGAKLISYIDVILEGKQAEETDMNLLLSTYSKWLRTFPFELSLFSHLKEEFRKSVPILKGKPEYNPYLKTSKLKFKTKAELIALLISRTEHLLSEINTANLLENKELVKPVEISIEILTKRRRMELNGLKEKFTDERKSYIKIIKEWYKGEEEFMHKLLPLLQAQTLPEIKVDQKEPSGKKLKEALAKYGFFELAKVKILSDEEQERLFALIEKESLPYKLAMFDYLEFIEYLEKNYFKVKAEMYKAISKMFGSDKDGRAVKANLSTLSTYTTENKERYTAHRHKEAVKKAYQNLK